MKAAQINQYGGVEVINLVDIAQPELAADQVRIKVAASSLNPSDTMIRSGRFKDMIPLTFPAVLGGDLSGVVEAVGSDVTHFQVGEEVYGQASSLLGASGSFAEYATTKPATLAKKPSNISFTEAASLPLVGVSAVQALLESIKLEAGQKILIHGGGGGIGSLAIQLAKHLGAYVATTAAPKDINFVKELGADRAIDYTAEKFEDTVHDFDAVFDGVGGESYDRSFAVLKRGGTIVSMVMPVNKDLAEHYGVTAFQQLSLVTTERLEKLAGYIEAGAIKVQIDKEFALADIKEAFTYRETTSPRGKVVVTI